MLACIGSAGAAERGRYSIIEDHPDQRPGAITRPSNAGDRAFRKGRGSPELRVGPTTARSGAPRRVEPPRYNARGQRLNVPGRPETYDQIGRSSLFPGRPRAEVAPIGPTVRTDAATRINQFPPR